jgi:hypothetical protein
MLKQSVMDINLAKPNQLPLTVILWFTPKRTSLSLHAVMPQANSANTPSDHLHEDVLMCVSTARRVK